MMSNMLHVADVFRCFLTICGLVHIHGFLPQTYNSSELIKTVEISSAGDVLVVTADRLLLFRNLSISNGDLVHEVKIANKEQPGTSHTDRAGKISFFSFIKPNDTELAIECTSEECFVHDLPNIKLFKQVNANLTYFPLLGTLGADRSAEAVFDSCPLGFCRIFSAQTTKDGVAYISERYMFVIGDVYHFSTSHSSSSFFQSVSGQNFDFLHSFQGGDNVYFLRNVRQDSGETHAIISQMCTNDDHLRSYMESKLECGGYSHLLSATTTNTTDGMFMFASFSLRPFIDDVTHTSESVICTYKVSELADYFDRTLSDCFLNARGYWPEWIDGIGESCSTKKKKLYKCGHTNLNTRVVSNTTLEMHFIKPKYHYETVVSMVLRQQGTRTLGYFGTQEGDIIKVLFNTTTNVIERTLKLDISNVPVKHVTLSKDGSSIFYIAGNSVGKVPLDTCGIHNDCYSCIMAKLNCVWSTDRQTGRDGLCVPESDVSKRVNIQHETYCRPIVYSIEPTSGPKGGGTTVTISGLLDIPAWYGILYPNDQVPKVPVTVQLGQAPCHVVSVSHFPNKLECVTEKQHHAADKLLRVTMPNVNIDTANTHRLIRSQGMAVNKPIFNFAEPSINDYTESTRPRVRLSGGIQITIYGTNLDIGNQHSKRITIGQKNCIITKYDRVLSGLVTCQAPAQSDSVTYDIVYTIDNNTIQNQPSVVYITDPIIADIQPRSSIVSGGVHLTISGEHLEGLGRNGVMLNIDILDQGEYKTITSECTFPVDRDTLVCQTSPATLHDGLPLYGQANLYNVYGKLVSLNISVYIVPDPTMEGEDKLVENSPVIQLFYRGEGLQNISNDDVRLQVGDKYCYVTEINSTGITCMIQNPTVVQIGLREKVECQIGLRTYDLGNVTFQDTDPRTSREAPVNLHTTQVIITSLKISGGAILGVMALGAAIFGIRRTRAATRRRKNERLSVHFRNRRVLNLQGLSENTTSESQQNRANDYVEPGLQRQDSEVTDVKETSPLLLDEQARDVFERKHLLIPSERLVVGESIGQGNFGCVYKGYLQEPEEKSERIVACKTLQRNKPREMDVSTFLKEALIMKDFHHKNVMELVGICLGIEKLPIVVLPFMRMGDVLSYIRNVENVPTVKDLVVFAVDIANGMYYLSQLKFVHRDLAARNCMIDEDMTVKVADFGLSRDIYEKEYYSSSDKKAVLPVKWMSPESLEYGLFTTKSDVWSFGVVLWELLTRGVNPYPTVDNWDILRYLKKDRRLNKPDFCPEEMYRIMQSCWQWNADDRPTFGDLTISIPERLRRLEKASERRKHLASLSEDRERNEEA